MKISISASNTLRSSFTQESSRFAGHKLFLIDIGDKFMVCTRFQWVGRRKSLSDAIALFERTLVGA
jgi:hypothetical protein